MSHTRKLAFAILGCAVFGILCALGLLVMMSYGHLPAHPLARFIICLGLLGPTIIASLTLPDAFPKE